MEKREVHLWRLQEISTSCLFASALDSGLFRFEKCVVHSMSGPSSLLSVFQVCSCTDRLARRRYKCSLSTSFLLVMFDSMTAHWANSSVPSMDLHVWNTGSWLAVTSLVIIAGSCVLLFTGALGMVAILLTVWVK